VHGHTHQSPTRPQVVEEPRIEGQSGQKSHPRARPVPRLLGLTATMAVLAVVLGLVVSDLVATPPSFSGVIEFPTIVDLNFAQSGQISTVLVHAGETVTVGQPLAIEDNPPAVAALQDSENVLSADEAVLTTLKAPRTGVNAVSPDRIAAAEVTVAAAEAQVDQDRLTVAGLTLFSTVSGVVVHVGGAPGDLDQVTGVPLYSASQDPPSALFGGGAVAGKIGGTVGSGQVGSTQPLLVIASGSPVAVVTVPQNRAIHVAPGMKATVHIDAVHKSVGGTVVAVDPTPVRGGSTAEYNVRLTIPQWSGIVLAGMTLHVSFP
jgi:multidrug efflux pump subunit AcrA (membrane-fusion protein)